MNMIAFFKKIVANDSLHAKWINTLSYLEYLGARKIIKSQRAETLSLHQLQHIAEEIRHAFFFKRIGETLYPEQCPSYDKVFLLGGSAAGNYFQFIDQSTDQYLKKQIPSSHSAILTYLYVSHLIETRALETYSQYREFMPTNGLSLQLASLIKEEENHLIETQNHLNRTDHQFPLHFKELKVLEEAAFSQLFKSFIASTQSPIRELSSI